MKVLYYCMSLTRSGGGLYTAMSGLAQAVKAQGVSLTVVGGADEHFEQDKHAWDGIDVSTHDSSGGYRLRSAVFSAIERIRPDIMHINGIWNAGSVYARYAQILGTKLVISPHGMLDPWILQRSWTLKAVHGLLFERSLLRRGLVHALNAAERDAVSKYEPSANTFVLPNGVNPVLASSSAVERTGALYLGRLHEKKQVFELVDAWSKLPGNQQILRIAGWGEPAYEEKLKTKIATTETVEFVGPVFGDEKTALLQQAKYFILPSLSEGLPMAVLEAAQVGALPIITEGCNLPELFQAEAAIRITEDFSDFESRLQNALSMPESQFVQMSQRAMQFSERYQWPAIGNAMISHYVRALET